jgi:tungstate transport system substrate-binding protein
MTGQPVLFKEKWCTEMVRSFRLTCVIGACFVFGCQIEPPKPASITLATTTSTQDSGLLDVLIPAFERQTGIKVKVVAVGSGQALELGRRGDADILLTHSPDAEKTFMNEGCGEKRLAVMHNDFIIVGPMEDKAGIKKARTAVEAFKMIAETHAEFVSRGDESGTHQKEKSIWKQSGIDPQGSWYVRIGAGMAQALRMGHEKKAYVLCDRATYLALKKEVELIVLVEGDDRLLNRYSVITINRAKYPKIHHVEANLFATFLVSSPGQTLIGTFGVQRYGQPLFVPDAHAY